jgi:hypothetical protein
VNHNFRDLVDHYHAWESDLAKFLVPQVYDFPEFVAWCTSNYISSKRTVISKDGSVLIEVIPKSITEMLRWPLNLDNEPLNEVVMAKCFRELRPEERVTLLQTYLCKSIDTIADNVVLESSLFPEIPRKFISMISVILGKYNDLVVDEFVLGIMVAIFPIITKPMTKFIFSQFLADQIHYQLSEFESLRIFRYQSYLVYLFLFSQAYHFTHCGLKVEI